jgi:hypothetical protein
VTRRWLDNLARRGLLARAAPGVYTVSGRREAGGCRSPSTAIAARLGDLRGWGRWGARVRDELLVDSGGHSMLERRLLALVRDAGLP